MTNSSFKASLWFTEKTPDFYFWIISFITLIVVCSSIKLLTLMHQKSTKIKFQIKVWHKWTLLFLSLLLIAMFIGELIFRMIAYYGVNPYHTNFMWKFNLFTSFLMIIMLGLWIFKGYLNGQWLEWRRDFFSFKIIKLICKKIKIDKYTNNWTIDDQDKLKKSKVKTDNSVIEIITPVSGVIKPLSKIKDEVFSKKLMGGGIAITPNSGKIFSPISGTVESAFHTGHAFGIKTNNGLSLLVHIGLNTVKLNGKGFKAMVKQGDKIIAGQPLSNVNLELIKKHKYSTDVIMVVLPESTKKISWSRLSGKATLGKMLFKVK